MLHARHRSAGYLVFMVPLLAILVGCIAPIDTDDTREGFDIDQDEFGNEVKIVAFNVESGDATAAKTAESVTRVKGESIWALVEVENEQWAQTFALAAADDGQEGFAYIMGTTGWADKIVIAWDDERFELLSSEELHDINVGGTARAPLVAHFRNRTTGTEFLFQANHLWRSEWQNRHEQARLLNDWALTQDLPVVGAGDYNFDWLVTGGDDDHDAGYDYLTEDDVWEWVRPEELIQTQCSTYYGRNVLDFVFVAGEAKTWERSSTVLEDYNSYCAQEDDEQSDHRPIQATFTLP